MQRRTVFRITFVFALLLFFSSCTEDNPQLVSEHSSVNTEDSMSLLIDVLGEKMEGHMLTEVGETEINGTVCRTFTFGVNSSERFEVKEHYAVSEEGIIYCMDIVGGGSWVLYEP